MATSPPAAMRVPSSVVLPDDSLLKPWPTRIVDAIAVEVSALVFSYDELALTRPPTEAS